MATWSADRAHHNLRQFVQILRFALVGGFAAQKTPLFSQELHGAVHLKGFL
jgi:hypothetical protein